MDVFSKGLVTILAVSLLGVVIAIPLALRKVSRNPLYGFRTPRTLADDYVWYEANAYFGRAFVIACIITMVTVLGLYAVPNISANFFFVASIVALVVPSAVATILAFRFMRTLTPGGPLEGSAERARRADWRRP